MTTFNYINYIAIVASLFTIISVCINIIQWRSRKSLAVTLKSRSQASYNYFYKIAEHSDTIRALPGNNEDLQQALNMAIQHGHSINGLSDAARFDIVSYSREHLNFIPIKENPAQPNTEQLPKPRKKRNVA